ncbi:tumor necrosis factor ligand superfamily member 14-like [Betta splendens]|uniref:Tumor necrosis factor ligand superfamily member 14-like n=1 Tax=Betta splendens TaxID=158456 RepID=A0A6P7M104_BETSP|nr:tumor necrosis factor ligand superfamily member 14-like [Betta splendens]
MAEGGVGTGPQVFVVDSQAACVSMPAERKPSWARVSHKCLLLLVGLAVLGLVVEGVFIYNLYKRTELAFLSCGSHPPCHNLSNPEKQQGTIMTQVGVKDSNEIPLVQPHKETQQRPFAHLIGSSGFIGKANVVQWISEGGEAITNNMNYSNGTLIIEREGYYYLYSKIQIHAKDCVVNQHKVMKDTRAYGIPIELMKSKRNCCKTQSQKSKETSPKPSEVDDIWNSFLAGIFHLQRGDKIFVSLENEHSFLPGNAYTFMGAFMISP